MGEKCLLDSHLPFVYVVILSTSPLWRTGETNPLGKTSKILFWIVMPTLGKGGIGLDCTAPKTKAKLDPQANFPRWQPPDLHANTGREAHQRICQFLIAKTSSIFLDKICYIFDVESMLIMVCYLKKKCGINQAEYRVT